MVGGTNGKEGEEEERWRGEKETGREEDALTMGRPSSPLKGKMGS